MSINIGNYTSVYAAATTKQTYIDKYDKSLKLPFLSVLNNSQTNVSATQANEIKTDKSVSEISDTVELSYAVSGAASADNQSGVSNS